MMEELELLEAKYQGAVARSREALELDFSIRYGDRMSLMLNEALKVYFLDLDSKVKVRRTIVDEMEYRVEGLIKARLSSLNLSLNPILVTWYYIGNGERVDRLKELLSLAGYGISIDDYVKAGFLMRIDKSTVVIPEYLAGYLSSAGSPQQLDSSSIVYGNIDNPLFMVALEAIARNLKPIEGFIKAFYGQGIRDALTSGLLSQVAKLHDGEVLVNPLIDLRSLRLGLARAKNTRAKVIKHSLSMYGKYMFDKEIYCGINYMFTYSSRSLVVYLCPWTPHYKSIISKHHGVRSLIVLGVRFRESMIEFLNLEKYKRPNLLKVMFITFDQALGEIHAIYQNESRSLMDDVLDILYESNYRVTEVTY
ncbi:hypothetical protein [Caldivirga sp. UBA161]|uniref:hypothetical protein n=1 Tax=Caldivirga sp. UBA161 TaxID=1915569 RepID=UPI0025B7D007|nr:hypothetical protein [Caldivirga sp. UBA161]